MSKLGWGVGPCLTSPTSGLQASLKSHKRLREQRVSDWANVSSNYAAWLVLSGAVAFVLLRE
jgi:hypothetical protein